MSTNAAADQDALYYLYVNGEWAGPYPVAQIREQVQQGLVAADSYAYAASQQRHFLVEELLAAPPVSNTAKAKPQPTPPETGSITQGMPALFDDVLDIAPQSAASFDNVLPDLKDFYQAYLGLTEHTAEPTETLKKLHGAHEGLLVELDDRSADVKALSRIMDEIDEVADYLANRQQLAQLWQRLSAMEQLDDQASPQARVESAQKVLAFLLKHAESQAQPSDSSSSVLLDLAGLEDEADSVITKKILLSARSEVANAKRDLDQLQQEIHDLQEQHAKDLERARKQLEKAEAARAEERHLARQTAAEVRNLAAEIQRLANIPEVLGGSDVELAGEIARLGEELKTADASTLAYIAEDVLIRLIDQLRQLAAGNGAGDSASLRGDLAKARESLTQAQAQVAQLTSERDALKLQYEQSRIAAEKASERAKDREHRLRSTVTALEVTKELHLEVMEDLKSQLQTAQSRVEQMERDLASVRGEMKDSTGTVEARGKAIQHEMQRMVEMKAMLEVRSNELSESLKSAEDELAKAQSSQEDTTLAEALAAKVTQLRATYEATTNRLRDQEANAARLASELEASRREAEELRGRSDQLSGELGEARGSLTAAKHRLDELNQAYARLEAEREALHTELHHRRSTDTIHKQATADEQQTDRIAKLELEASQLQRQLTNERRQIDQLNDARLHLESRISELTAERTELQRKFEVLQNEHFNDHARHTAAIAVSTQAAIEGERRLRELQNRISELEGRLASARKGTEGDSLEPTTARVSAHGNALETPEQEGLRAELEQVVRERDHALAELDTIRTTATPAAEVPESVAKRLVELERQLTATKAEFTGLDERLAQAGAERDRLRRELERLKGEREAAAVEHRAALKSARDRLSESQEHVAALERQLAERSVNDGQGQVLRGHLDQSLAEQERLSKEVQRLVGELARLNAAVPADRDQQLIAVARASQQLAAEQEKVLVLTRSLMETIQQADSARGRTLELQSQLDQRTNERDRLQQELDRQRAEITNLRLGNHGGLEPTDDIKATVSKRDQAIADLDQVRKDLTEARVRLTDTHRAATTLDNLSQEQARIRELEKQLTELRSDADQRQQMFNEARARLVQVSSERDRLAAELAELKSRPDQSSELKMLRRRLIRAKRLIKRLKRERDDAIAERMKSATNLHQLTGQLERLKLAQRAAAEALGLPPSAIPADLPGAGENSHGSRVATGLSSGGFGTRELGQALVPLTADAPASKSIPKALTRRIMPAQSPKQPGLGFTSAFGRPMIPPPPGVAPAVGSESAHNIAIQTHVTSVLSAKPPSQQPWSRRLGRSPLGLGVLAASAMGAAALFLLPPFIPLSTQAVVIAPVTVVEAPIDGQFQAESLTRLSEVTRGQLLGTITNDHVDTSSLKALQARRESTRAKQSEAREQLDESQRTLTTLREQVELYRTGLIQDLDRRLGDERAELAKRNTTLGTTLDRAAVPGALAAVESQQSLIEQLSRRLTVLRSGQFDAADAPVAQRRIEEQTARIAELEEQGRVLGTTVNELEVSITEEEQRVAALRSATLNAPVTGTLWSQPATNRQPLTRGGEVLRLADPTRLEVVALLPERYRYDVTSDSVIEVITDSGRHLRGTIIGGQLLPATNQKSGMTSELMPPAQGYDKLYIALDPSAAPLPIGQQVKIVVLEKNPGFIDRTLAWFYETTRL
jgi:chromosome segregation ATPase